MLRKVRLLDKITQQANMELEFEPRQSVPKIHVLVRMIHSSWWSNTKWCDGKSHGLGVTRSRLLSEQLQQTT